MRPRQGATSLAILALVAFGFMSQHCVAGAASSKKLTAPTYYIATTAKYWDQITIKFRGASNLPAGAAVSIYVAEIDHDGWREFSDAVCISVDEEGFFNGTIQPKRGINFPKSALFLIASFAANECKQPPAVLQIIGKKGQYLGNDNYDNAVDVAMRETDGMIHNPQLGQGSGWYFGLSSISRVGR